MLQSPPDYPERFGFAAFLAESLWPSVELL